MPIIDFTGSYRDATRGMTIKALQDRQKALQDELATQVAPRQISSPLQGVAQLTGVLANRVNEGRAQADEMAGRKRFAELLAGGITPDELGEAMSLDPEGAKYVQTHQWDVEQQKTEREQAIADKMQSHGWDVEKATAAVEADKAAAAEKARVDAEAAKTGHGYDTETAATLAKTQEASKIADDQRAAEEKRREEQAAANEPQSASGKIMADYNNGKYGEKGTPDAIAIMKTALAKENAISGKSQTISVDKDGNVTVSESSGPGAGLSSSNPSTKEQAATLEGYRTAAAAATELTPMIDMMEHANENTGWSGAGGTAWGTADDIITGAGKLLGKDWGGVVAGDPTSRGIMKAGSMTFLNNLIAKTKGAISDAENARIVNASPGLEQSYDGNKIMLAIARAVAKRSQQKAAEAEKWLKTSDTGDLSGFEGHWQELIDKNPIFDFDARTGQYLVEGKPYGGGAPPSAAQPAATQPAPAAPTAPAAPAAAGGGVKPADIPQAEWDVMTPEEKAAFQ